MSNFKQLLRVSAVGIAVIICMMLIGCASTTSYTVEELLLAKGSEFAAAGPLSSQPQNLGDPISDPSVLIGKWKAEGEIETIKLNGNDTGNYMADQMIFNQIDKQVMVEEYDFKADGTYSLFTTISEKSGTVFSKNRILGKWSLQNGELTLIPSSGSSDGSSIPMKLSVTACPEQGIAIQYASSEAWENYHKANQAKGNERLISQAAPNARELVRKSLNQQRYTFGWDSRGYSVMRNWSVDDNNRVQSGMIFIFAYSPAAFKRYKSIWEYSLRSKEKEDSLVAKNIDKFATEEIKTTPRYLTDITAVSDYANEIKKQCRPDELPLVDAALQDCRKTIANGNEKQCIESFKKLQELRVRIILRTAQQAANETAEKVFQDTYSQTQDKSKAEQAAKEAATEAAKRVLDQYNLQ